ncbi:MULTISPECIES: alpha-ketoacid dehydrogenase subunit beta [unclassified Gemella]|uniref:alpha-ketoacid dehydrogenase subunit beta n=1 Tax=unclassified Gemella TaxID=2624949 RepID=UPI0015D09FEA|nr:MULTISPECIES: pyruvate dehydrogenase complex E1 component subunit beta [unclassified Gemella]MBF0710299.1 alpha-ketoacid dehydrogenase subunit beta [Gemella sp. GL1.1]NYS27643.1 alpha-ketoacid dehydrogenase subunit beta [Gemella sp. GL1]
MTNKIMTVREAIKEAMTAEMRADENVFLMGEDVGIFGGDFGTTVGMLEEFGEERVIDTPISESAIAGAAAGAAATGMRPIVDITFMDFVTIAMDAIVNQAAPMRYMLGGEVAVPVVYRCASGAGTGAAAQHCKALEAWFCHIPGLKVVAPGTPQDIYSVLRASVRDNNPVIYIEPKALFGRKGEVDETKVYQIGKGEVKHAGEDITLVSWGRMLERSLQAAEELKEEGIEVEVIDPITLVPLDTELIVESVKKTGKLAICHDSFKTGGFGGEIAARIAESDAFDFLDSPIYRIAGADTHIPSAKNLEVLVVPDVEAIKETLRKAVNKK